MPSPSSILKWNVRPLVLALSCVCLVAPATSLADGNWHTHATNLSSAQSKVKQFEHEIDGLIQQKKTTHESEELKRVLDDIAAKYKQYREAVEAYNQESLHIRFKHPDRGLDGERKYSRYEVKTLKELESDIGLEGKLDRIKKTVRAAYHTEAPPEEQAESEESRTPASTADESSEKLILRK